MWGICSLDNLGSDKVAGGATGRTLLLLWALVG
jgi:hypothetical protein